MAKLRLPSLALLAVPAVLLTAAPRASADEPAATDATSDLEDLDLVKLMGLGLSDLVVSGAAKHDQSLDEVAAAASVITADQIKRFGYRTVAEALGSVAGVYITDDHMVQRVGVRGLQLLGDANTRLLVLVDGSTINEPWSQAADAGLAIPLSIDEVERIEVIRGPVSSVYGTNAFFGIINIVTKKAGEGVHGYGRVEADSFGTLGGSAGASYGKDDQSVRAFASWSHRSGETLTYPGFAVDGERTSTSSDGLKAFNGGVTATYEGARLQLRGGQQIRELPGAPYDSLTTADNENRDRYLMAEGSYSHSVLDDALTLTARTYLNRYTLRSNLMLETNGGPSGAEPFESNVTSTWYGGELRGLWSALSDGKLDITGGLAAEHTDTHSDSGFAGDAPITVNKPFTTTGLYTEISTHPLDWVSASGGLRYDYSSLFSSRVSPRGALFFTAPSKLYGAKLMYAEGFRNPSILESYYDDGARYHPSGTQLRPESITATEAVAWVRPVPGLEVRLSGFNWKLVDIIEKRSVYDPTVLAERFQFQNLADLSSRGLELEASYRQADGWLGFAGATLAKIERNEGYEDPINAPAVTLTAGLSTPKLFGLVHASVDSQLVSSRNTRSTAETADTWLGLNAALHAPSLWGFDVTLGVRNILGTRDQVPAQSDYDRVFQDNGTLRDEHINLLPGPGREFFLRAGYEY
jgi:outer membrane receptor protein involved in Fe transport